MFVVDNNYETKGNRRIVVYLAGDLKDAQGMFPMIEAKKVFMRNTFTEPAIPVRNDYQTYSPVALAFNSKNQMVVGNDGYDSPPGELEKRQITQLYIYSDPLKKNQDGTFVQNQKPDGYIQLPIGSSGEITFDSSDNLIVQDHTWPKVWIINLDKDSSWIFPL